METVAVAERTLIEWLVKSGITEARALEHVRDGWVRVDGERVTDPTHPAGPPARVELRVLAPADAGV